MKNKLSLCLAWFNELTPQRKVEFVSVLLSSFIILISATFLISTSKPASIDKATIDKLIKQREILEQNSESLIKAVADMHSIIRRNNVKDSIVEVLISKQSDLIPNINFKLNEIDKSYRNIANISSYNSEELKRYITAEANRIRNSMPPDK